MRPLVLLSSQAFLSAKLSHLPWLLCTLLPAMPNEEQYIVRRFPGADLLILKPDIPSVYFQLGLTCVAQARERNIRVT